MTEITIKSLPHYIEEIFLNDESGIVYRGERLVSRPVRPKIGRMKTASGKTITMEHEKAILRSFSKRGKMLIKSPPTTDIDWMMLAQHHGLPTRMLDLTTNPLVALYFAVEKPMRKGEENESSAVYGYIDNKPLRQEKLDPFKLKSDTYIIPFYNHDRMISQQARFLIFADPHKELTPKNVKKYIINGNIRKEVKKHLNKCGINKANLFNTLDAVAEFLEWGASDAH